MLAELHIANFALIDRLRVEFKPGLNVLTGETGAGKSILIDAIGAVLGERTGPELVRSGTSKAAVDAVFAIEPPSADGRPANNGQEPGTSAEGLPPWRDAVEDGQILISREVVASGRSQARINGRPVTASALRDLSRHLVDLHGQHEHQSLLSVEHHANILDHWIGAPATALRDSIADLYCRWTELSTERTRLVEGERDRARRLDLYRYQIEEIDAANLVIGEEEGLLADRVRLAGAERLAGALQESLHLLDGAEVAALETLGTVVGRLNEAAGIDPDLKPLAESVESALFSLEESARDLRRARDAVEFNPERLNAVEERLDLLKSLRRKYGDSIEEVLEYRQRIGAEMDEMEHGEQRLAGLENEIAQAEASLRAQCGQLSDLRKAGAARFAQGVMAELADLGMQKTRFEVSIEPQEPTARGADSVEFLMSANPGEPLKPLARVASGGEMSRIMLALKSTVVRSDAVPVMIFDEIDVGVGGHTASVLAQKLRSLADRAQILCVTHLPQVAAAAHHHIYISKAEVNGRTVVSVAPVSGKPRMQELARMLGNAESATALRHAQELLNGYDGAKRRGSPGSSEEPVLQPSLFQPQIPGKGAR